MKNKDFEALMERRIGIIRSSLATKQKQYAVGDERLSNFYATARMNDCTPEAALWGMLSKHIICTKDAVKALECDVIISESIWNELMKDMINYPFLLDGLMTDRRNNRSIYINNELTLPAKKANTDALNVDNGPT